jgi:pyruvate dehydrogenase E1 component subunit alpha
MYTWAEIGGYCHLNLGEEATGVGLMDALRPTDYQSTPTGNTATPSPTARPGRVMAELFGRTTGLSGGRGGSMHLS